MKYTYYLTYSCYENKLNILLNNAPLSPNSAALQYMDEPFYIWYDKIFDVLYKEIDEDYQVVYMGRPEEAAILHRYVKKKGGCVELIQKEFPLKQSLQERIIGLSRLIKQNHLHQLPPVQMNAVFLGEEELLSSYGEDIDALQIGNIYCKTTFSAIAYTDRHRLSKGDIVFLLASDLEEADKKAASMGNCPYLFLLIEEMKEGFQKAEKNRFYYGISKDTFANAVFAGFLLFPLAECFSAYASAMLKVREKDDLYYQMKSLLAVRPVIRMNVEKKVEYGCSLPIDIQVYPSGHEIPELVFEYQLPGIVSCTSKELLGNKTGKTKVRAYEKGSTDLIAAFEVEVYKRNRITSLVLSEHNLVMGTGERKEISCEYLPADADNVEKITWTSGDPSVVCVDKNGVIHALSTGSCEIICSAEGVTSRCRITVKPYLEEIIFPECIQNDSITMNIGERVEIACTCIPADAYDGWLIYGSNNLMVANMENRTLVAVSSGEADITIESTGKRITKTVHVVVNRQQKKKKKGLFGFFG